MAKVSKTAPKMRPALTPEARENQLISLAVDLAEKQIREGTASSQVITHFLKLGSTTAKLEHERKMKELELMAAKTKDIESRQHSEELLERAMKAFSSYSGRGGADYDDYEDYN